MKTDSSELTVIELIGILDSLRPWTRNPYFSTDEWGDYKNAAKVLKRTDSETVVMALSEFIKRSIQKKYLGYEDESKPFILMRVLFDLPDRIDIDKYRYFKGWNNWPAVSKEGKINSSWPVDWSGYKPKLIAAYDGSMGLPYAAAEEYSWFRQHFPFRNFQDKQYKT